MKRLIMLFLLLMLSLPTLAQDATLISSDEAQSHAARVLSFVQTVELIESEGEFALHLFGTMPDGCERPTFITTERQGAVLFVDVFHDPMPQTLIACPKMLLPIDAIVPVGDLLTQDENQQTRAHYLVVNDQYFGIIWDGVQSNSTSSGDTAARLMPAVRTGLRIDTITPAAHEDGLVYVEFAGWLPEGCNDPVLSRLTATPDETNTYSIEIFRILENPVMCPLTYVPVPFEIAVPTPLNSDETGEFRIAGEIVYYPPMTSAEPDSTPVLHVIDSVEAVLLKSNPAQINLLITGHQTDSCRLPVDVTQTWSDNNHVKIEIFRDLPPNVRCAGDEVAYTATIRLDSSFLPGTYTIDVNGTVITVKI